MLFKPRTINEAYVQAQYIKNIRNKKGYPSGSKNKECEDASMEGKKKWKREGKKTTTTTHHCKGPNDHCNHCNIDGHTKGKCWKIHLEMNPKNYKKDVKKKNLLTMDVGNQVKSNKDVGEKIIYTTVWKEVNMSSINHKDEKEMTKLLHIKI